MAGYWSSEAGWEQSSEVDQEDPRGQGGPLTQCGALHLGGQGAGGWPEHGRVHSQG